MTELFWVGCHQSTDLNCDPSFMERVKLIKTDYVRNLRKHSDRRETLANELREGGSVEWLQQGVRNEYYVIQMKGRPQTRWADIILRFTVLGKMLKKIVSLIRSVLYYIKTHSCQREWVDAASMQWCLFVLMKFWRPVCRVISNFGIWGPPSQPRVFFSAQTRWSIIYLCSQSTLLKSLK